MKRLSKVFQPINIIPNYSLIKPSAITSKSQKLMLDLGLIRSTGYGSYHILPLLQKSIEKYIQIIDRHMENVGAQKLAIPKLTPIELWKKSGRFDSGHTELMITKDRHEKNFILGPVC